MYVCIPIMYKVLQWIPMLLKKQKMHQLKKHVLKMLLNRGQDLIRLPVDTGGFH